LEVLLSLSPLKLRANSCSIEKQACPCAVPEHVFAARKLTQIDGDLLHGLKRAKGPPVFVPCSLRGEDRNGSADGGEQESVVRGEVLKQQGELAIVDEDGKRVLRRQSADEVGELLVEVHLSDDVYGDGVEGNNVEDGRWVEEVVAEGVRGERCCGRDDEELRAGVLFEEGDVLRFLVVEDVEGGMA
jgi:hypothetical protein